MREIAIIFFFISLNVCFGAQKNRLIEMAATNFWWGVYVYFMEKLLQAKSKQFWR